jgi:hypothetical protein
MWEKCNTMEEIDINKNPKLPTIISVKEEIDPIIKRQRDSATAFRDALYSLFADNFGELLQTKPDEKVSIFEGEKEMGLIHSFDFIFGDNIKNSLKISFLVNNVGHVNMSFYNNRGLEHAMHPWEALHAVRLENKKHPSLAQAENTWMTTDQLSQYVQCIFKLIEEYY